MNHTGINFPRILKTIGCGLWRITAHPNTGTHWRPSTVPVSGWTPKHECVNTINTDLMFAEILKQAIPNVCSGERSTPIEFKFRGKGAPPVICKTGRVTISFRNGLLHQLLPPSPTAYFTIEFFLTGAAISITSPSATANTRSVDVGITRWVPVNSPNAGNTPTFSLK